MNYTPPSVTGLTFREVLVRDFFNIHLVGVHSEHCHIRAFDGAELAAAAVRRADAVIARMEAPEDGPCLAERVRKHLAKTTPATRIGFLNAMFTGYCKDCGCEAEAGSCNCMRDE